MQGRRLSEGDIAGKLEHTFFMQETRRNKKDRKI